MCIHSFGKSGLRALGWQWRRELWDRALCKRCAHICQRCHGARASFMNRQKIALCVQCSKRSRNLDRLAPQATFGAEHIVHRECSFLECNEASKVFLTRCYVFVLLDLLQDLDFAVPAPCRASILSTYGSTPCTII